MMVKMNSFSGLIECSDALPHQEHIDSFFEQNNSFETINNLFVVPADKGETGIQILGTQEKDYHFYDDLVFEQESLLKLCEAINTQGIDNIKIPLLNKDSADDLKQKFSKVLPMFTFHVNLSAISPVIDKQKLEKHKLRNREIRKFLRDGAEVKPVLGLDTRIANLHTSRWGNNRSQKFYDYLKFMNKEGLSEGYGLYANKKLIAYIQLIGTGNILHYYYSIYDHEYSGAGTAIIQYALQRFLEDERFRYFSFGRGAETYKFSFANTTVLHYELRGFFSPCEGK